MAQPFGWPAGLFDWANLLDWDRIAGRSLGHLP